MNKVQKIDYIKGIEEYLEKNHTYELFEHLMRQLIIHEPEDPQNFLIEKLKNPDGKKLFVVGPPGSNVRELTQQQSDHFETVVVSVGDQLKKEVSKKTEMGQKIEEYIKNQLYVPDDMVIDILKEHLATLDQQKHILIEGFPKTIYQSMAMQRAGIMPDMFLQVNYPNDQCEDFVRRKFSEQDYSEIWSDMSETERSSRSKDYLFQYTLNIKEQKRSYKNDIQELDGSLSTAVDDMARQIKFKIKARQPCRSFRIIVVGPIASGRNTVAAHLAKRFGFVDVSIAALLMDQIKNKSPVGAVVSEYIRNRQLVPDEIVFGLLKSRLERADCKVHGFVLENFPKNDTQMDLLEQMKLDANLIVAQDYSVKATNMCKYVDPVSGYKYKTEDLNLLEKCVQDRLKPLNSTDQPGATKKELDAWESFYGKLKDKYSDKIQNIDANLCVENIIEKISFTLERDL